MLAVLQTIGPECEDMVSVLLRETGAQRQARVRGSPTGLLDPRAFLLNTLASMSAQNWPKDGLLVLIPLERSLPPQEPGEPGNSAGGMRDTSVSPSPAPSQST